MSEQIENLVGKLSAADWSVKTAALSELMAQTDPQAADDFYEILDKKSENLCIYFCQFLGKTLMPNSPNYLLEFISDKRERVSQEATWAMDKYLRVQTISEKDKVAFLIKALKTPEEKGRVYVTESFGKFYKKEGGPYLLEVINDKSPKVRLACVDSLRAIGDPKSATYILKAIADSDYNVRYAVCFAMGELGSPSHYKSLLPLLEDPKATVRQAATWAYARLGGTNAVTEVIKRLEQDKAPIVKLEAIKRLAKINTAAVVKPLLKAMSKDEDQNVKNTASYALDSLDEKIRLSIYIKELNNEDKMIRNSVLGKLSKVKAAHTFDIILKEFKRSEKEPQIQSACAEGFGSLGDKRAIPILKDALTSNPIVAYSAIRSLAALLGHEEKHIIIELLTDKKIPDMSKQIILQFLLKKTIDKQFFLDNKLIEIMISNLLLKHVNIAYLSARILGATHDMSAILPLLETSLTAVDPELKNKCFNSVSSIVGGNMVLLIKLLQQSFVRPEIKERILHGLSTFECKEEFKLATIVALISYSQLSPKQNRIKIISLLSQVVGESANILLQVLYQTQWPTDILKEILYILDGKIKEGEHENIFLKIDSLNKMIQHKDKEVKFLAIRILEKIGQREAIPTLMNVYLNETEPRVKAYTKVAIRSIVSAKTTSKEEKK